MNHLCVCLVGRYQMLELPGPENTVSRGFILRIRPKQMTVMELGASRAKARVRHSSSGIFAYTASKAGRVLCRNYRKL